MIRRLLTASLLLSSLLFRSSGPAVAQVPAGYNLATDTLQPANAKYHVPVSQLGTTNGSQYYVFINYTALRNEALEFTWRHPLALPRPRPIVIKLEQVHYVRTSGQYLEPVRLPNLKAQALAQRRLAGPRLELFDIAWPKTKAVSLIPVVGMAALLLKTDSADYEHLWFVRRPGEKTMTQLPPGKKFAPFLADYLADAPSLATGIRSGAAGHGYYDVPALLRAYNRTVAPN